MSRALHVSLASRLSFKLIATETNYYTTIFPSMLVGSIPIEILAIGILWGATNPFMGRGATGIERKPTFLAQMVYLFTRWQVGAFSSSC